MDDQECLRIIQKDLQFLTEQWEQDISDDSLRRSSVILRRLIVEDTLIHGWRIAGFDNQPTFLAPTLEDVISTFDILKITFASAGGGKNGGLTVSRALLTPEQQQAQFKAGPFGQAVPLKLVDFRESVCLVIQGELVKRRELIKYVANKLGGAHLDMRRNITADNPKLADLENKYAKLDSIVGSMEVAAQNAVYFELLSIGQSLIESEDVKKLVDSTTDKSS